MNKYVKNRSISARTLTQKISTKNLKRKTNRIQTGLKAAPLEIMRCDVPFSYLFT